MSIPNSETNNGVPYTQLPESDNNSGNTPASSCRRPKKSTFMILTGLVAFLLFFVAVKYGNNDDSDDVNPGPVPPEETVCNMLGSNLMPLTTMRTLARGVAKGVSAKSRGHFLGARPFPWTQKMLAWQRTSFHFQPKKNWMNDPNGPLYYKGWYHLFYQYNPEAAVWGNIVWGHAVSKDLIHWQHLPVAMVADQWYDINGVWTGSATFLPNGDLIMLYTGSTNELAQVQNLAYPADPSDPLLRKWIKYEGNPVLIPPPGIGLKDFRDPTTAWTTPEGKWRITIGSKINKTGISLVYDTIDFKKFELLKGVLHGVPGTGMWECVDFYPVSKIVENGLDTSENGPAVKHVLKSSLDDDRNDYYALGTYDAGAGKWVPDNPIIDVGIGLRYDYGNFYASKTFYDQEKKRRVLWAWIKETDSEAADICRGWASLQSIPRTIKYDKKTGSNIITWPVAEVENLRSNNNEFNKVVVKPGSIVPLEVGSATQLDIMAEFEVDQNVLKKVDGSNATYDCIKSGGSAERGALGPFGLLVLTDNSLSEQTPIYFYIAKDLTGNFNTFFCNDLTRSSEATDVRKLIYGSTVPVLQGEKLSLRALVDHSIVESFAQNGRTAITSRVYPTKAIYENAKIYLFNNATDISVTATIKIWQMNSANIKSN
ncbi:acid beta-fructofuranosidase 2, vacuolar [Solanum verrucosum]|uniref:acid beta-fructofuranosidase 2, vacuolar n=1 Tax=Solanum verrucosum TaxID=315347 RepID=UPI0020D032C3|nr:acid beta-fructofuranosidase 2, vacuolar [Solanum verrucosum]